MYVGFLSSRLSKTITQQIGLEETIIKEIEQNQLTWYGHVQRMAEGRLPKIELKWMEKQKSKRETEEELDGRNKEGHERKKPKRKPVGR
jgi:hypothetical protein